MSSVVIYQEGKNPYINDPNATESGSRSIVTHEGRHYTKLSYDVKIAAWTRLLQIIKAVALTIFTCFIALAFEQVRTLWAEGIKGTTHITILELGKE